MDNALPSALLTGQHRQIDVGVNRVVGGTGSAAALEGSLGLLRNHLYAEETILFPPMAAAGLTMPVFVMKREHGQMWPLMLFLEKACAAGASLEALHDKCRELQLLLQVHNTKEETILYAAADRAVQADAHSALVAGLQEARAPAAWACAMAPKAGAHAASGTASLASILGKRPKL